MAKAPRKTKNFKADETEKAQFTEVNEHFEVEVQRRNSKILEVHFGKIEHIGIAVRNIGVADSLYEQLLGVASYKKETVESEGVITSFFMAGNNKIELLQGTNAGNAISAFIEKKGEGIHHIAFEVEDILAEMERLKKEGFTLVNEQPKRGADNKLICFVHPKSTNGVLIELCQEIK